MESETCPTCFGRGHTSLTAERLVLYLDLGLAPTAPRCWRCNGTGRVPKQEEPTDADRT